MSSDAVATASAAAADSSYTAFRLAEKHYKNRSKPGVLPSLRNRGIIDLSRPKEQASDEVWSAGWWSPLNDTGSRSKKGKERERGERPEEGLREGLREIRIGDKWGYVVAEGCILIPQYLSVAAQLTLLRSALRDYTLPPNPLSLSTHYSLPPDLFALYAADSPDLIPPLCEVKPSRSSTPGSGQTTNGAGSAPASRQTIETLPGSVVGFEEILAKNKTFMGDVPSDKLKAKTAGDLMREVRWANLGWVYQWGTKAYDFTPEVPIPFPKDLDDICTEVVRTIPWDQVFEGNQDAPPDWARWKDDYAPDTGIVNFYQLNDTLMGHVDRAELDPSRPLVSISLGHSCIFLLGSASRDDQPQPIILRSGDILIMSGKGRQNYHGVPRIMEGTLPPHFAVDGNDDEVDQAVKRWISTARVNINARQVFPPDFKRPVQA